MIQMIWMTSSLCCKSRDKVDLPSGIITAGYMAEVTKDEK